MTVTSSLKRGLVAGVCAGILTALFAFVFAEPTINRSIALEEQRAAATSADHAATGHAADNAAADPVSRDVQRRIGAPAGFILVGLALGALFGLLSAGLRAVTDERDPWRRSLVLAGAAIAVVLVPFLRYPPNPPGVGDPDTIDERTRYYFAALLLGLAVVIGAWRLSRFLRERGWEQSHRQLATGVVALVVVGLAFAVMPTPADEVLIPAKLLWEFRVQSLATQLLLLVGIAAGFGVLTERAARASG